MEGRAHRIREYLPEKDSSVSKLLWKPSDILHPEPNGAAGSDDDRIAPVAQTESSKAPRGIQTPINLSLIQANAESCTVGKYKSPAKMGARSPRENGCLKPRRWVPEAP